MRRNPSSTRYGSVRRDDGWYGWLSVKAAVRYFGPFQSQHEALRASSEAWRGSAAGQRARKKMGLRNPRPEAAWATLEYLRPGEAIVELHSTSGKWLGGGLVQVRSRSRHDLYEAGYNSASQRAHAHGLSLERFRWA